MLEEITFHNNSESSLTERVKPLENTFEIAITHEKILLKRKVVLGGIFIKSHTNMQNAFELASKLQLHANL